MYNCRGDFEQLGIWFLTGPQTAFNESISEIITVLRLRRIISFSARPYSAVALKPVIYGIATVVLRWRCCFRPWGCRVHYSSSRLHARLQGILQNTVK